MQIGAAQLSLSTAIEKCQGAAHEQIIKTVALERLEYGFSAAPGHSGFVLRPVSFHLIGDAVRKCFPGDDRKLTEILSTAQCQRYFTVVHGPPRPHPHVVIHLMAQVLAGGTCYMFDVFQAGLAVTYELRLMLEDKDIVKSMHDCRQDSAALFYQMGINLQNIFDAQVAHGLTEFWEGIMDASEQKQERIGLSRLLAWHGLSAHTSKQAVQDKMMRNPMLWSKRPIPQDLLQYAAEDVQQLLMLADKLSAELGKAELRLLSRLSAAYSQWYWDPAHRDGVANVVNDTSLALTVVNSGSWLVQLLEMARARRSPV